MTTLIATYFSGFASLLLSFYFLYRWVRQKPRNNSTLAWALGFLVYSVTDAVSGYIYSGLFSMSPQTYNSLSAIRGLLTNLFFLLIFWGTVRLISRRPLIVYGLTTLGFLFASSLVITAKMITTSDLGAIKLISYALYLPVGMIFCGIFLILYGVLMAEAAEKRWGVILIIISWVIYIGLSLALPSLFSSHLDYWYVGRGVSTLILLVGFFVLEKEAGQAFIHLEEDKKLHHHFK